MVQKRKKGRKGGSRKKSRKKKDFSRVALLSLISLLAVLAITVILLYTKQRTKYEAPGPVKPPKALSEKVPRDAHIKQGDVSERVTPREIAPARAYKVAIIIDDLGYNNGRAEELFKIDAALTFSIFPFGPYSKSLAQKAHVMGREVMLHLPMEPHRYPQKNPGDGTLLLDMNDEELLRKLDADIRSVPFIKGVNNHMGSKFTENEEKMRVVLTGLEKRNLFFLDSKTSGDSVGYSMAKKMGLKAAERNIFLDNIRDVELITAQIRKLARLSLKNGSAIGIGHPYPPTIKALKQMLPELKAKGIEVVPVSHLVE
ncbi:MAG: divergent polysaccharide deacetylase family protein [Pseudomonadota bacterium]